MNDKKRWNTFWISFRFLLHEQKIFFSNEPIELKIHHIMGCATKDMKKTKLLRIKKAKFLFQNFFLLRLSEKSTIFLSSFIPF